MFIKVVKSSLSQSRSRNALPQTRALYLMCGEERGIFSFIFIVSNWTKYLRNMSKGKNSSQRKSYSRFGGKLGIRLRFCENSKPKPKPLMVWKYILASPQATISLKVRQSFKSRLNKPDRATSVPRWSLELLSNLSAVTI